MYTILIESAEYNLELDNIILTEGFTKTIKDKLIKFKNWLLDIFNRFKTWITNKISSIKKLVKAEFGKVSFKDVYEANKDKYAKIMVTAYPIDLLHEIERLIDSKPKDEDGFANWEESIKKFEDKFNSYEEGPITLDRMKVLGGNSFSSLEKNMKIYTTMGRKIGELLKTDSSTLLERLTNKIINQYHKLIGMATKIIRKSIKFNDIIVMDKIDFANKHSLTRVEFIKHG